MRTLALCLLAGTLASLPAAPTAAEELTAVAPQPGEAVALLRPAIVFAVPAGIDRRTVRLLLDGVDLSEFVTWSAEQVRAVPPLPVAEGAHSAEVRRRLASGGDEVIGKVEFQTVAPRRRVLSTGHYADAPMGEKEEGHAAKLTVAPHLDGAVAGTAGELRYDLTWPHVFASGVKPGPPPAALVHYERGTLLATAGASQGTTFEGAQLLGIASARQIVEGGWNGAIGPLSLLASIPGAPQGTAGARSFEQAVGGLSWQALGSDRLTLRLFGQRVSENGRGGTTSSTPPTSLAQPEDADLLGLLAGYKLGAGWEGQFEAAWSRRRLHPLAATGAEDANDSAYRLEVHGTLDGHLVQAHFSRIGARYGDPANPGIVRDREEAGLDVSRTVERWNYRLFASSSHDALATGLPTNRELHGGFALGATLPWEVHATVGWDQQRLTGNLGASDNRIATFGLARTWTGLMVNLMGKRTATEAPGSSTISTGWQASALLGGTGAWSLNAGAGVETRSQAGHPARNATFSLQPSMSLFAGRLGLALDLMDNLSRPAGQPEVETLATRGSATWKLPDGWQGATVTVELGWQRIDRVHDRSALLRLAFAPSRQWRR